MTPKELGELGHLEAAVPVVESADFPPVEADEPLEPGLRKSVTLLRGFADLAPDKPKRMVFDFFAKPVASRATARSNASSSRDRARRERRGARHRRDLRGAGIADHHRDRLFDLADRRRAVRRRQVRQRRAAASPTGSTQSAGPGAVRPERSAPTAPTAMKWPTRLPPQCPPEAPGIATGAQASSGCSRAAA